MDSTTDNSLRTLWRMVKAAGAIPDYLRNGALVDAGDAEKLPDTAFADSMHRRFPITDRANTWASAGYFAKTASDYGYSAAEQQLVLHNIKRAAQIYGIAQDIDDLMERVSEPEAQQVKQATAADYCDPENHGYPVFDKQGAELANDFFSRNAYKYGYEQRQRIARNIMRKSAEYGVKAAEQVRLSAGAGFPNREVLAEHLVFRANELLNRGINKMASELCKFAQVICMSSDEDLFRCRDGLFNAIGSIDEMTGMDDGYGVRFYSPEEMLYDITPEDMQSIIDDAVPLGSETFSAKALSELPAALFERVMPHESVMGMMDGGHISPKKLSITIVKMKRPESDGLLQVIRDFTRGAIDVDECPECDPPELDELEDEEPKKQDAKSDKDEKKDEKKKDDKED